MRCLWLYNVERRLEWLCESVVVGALVCMVW